MAQNACTALLRTSLVERRGGGFRLLEGLCCKASASPIFFSQLLKTPGWSRCSPQYAARDRPLSRHASMWTAQ
ncbi:hypothetical protein CSW62_14060 [Caulobacter sp. FWC2]|nr:hypothetical protein CSW62_13120 [Caulobacter sp. FWC2]PIB92595.1 hypothetical protein CSW62_14060 [Caulobacter sp. FWC2]